MKTTTRTLLPAAGATALAGVLLFAGCSTDARDTDTSATNAPASAAAGGGTEVVVSRSDQREPAPGDAVTEGDVVWFPAGVKHWHGATADEPMTHIAVHETVDDSNVTWMEPVTDAQYLDQN